MIYRIYNDDGKIISVEDNANLARLISKENKAFCIAENMQTGHERCYCDYR